METTYWDCPHGDEFDDGWDGEEEHPVYECRHPLNNGTCPVENKYDAQECKLLEFSSVDKGEDMKKWKPFYFDGNEAWGTIDSPEEWSRIKRAYKTDLGKAKRCDLAKADGRDVFGRGAGCYGKETLKEFFESNGMEI
jgi:hypothetical protein